MNSALTPADACADPVLRWSSTNATRTVMSLAVASEPMTTIPVEASVPFA
jgi:hypothetical protein